MAGRPLASSTSSEPRRQSKKKATLFSGRSGSPFIFGHRFSLNLAPPRLRTPPRAQGRRPLQPSTWASIAGLSATTRHIRSGCRTCCSGHVWRWRLAKKLKALVDEELGRNVERSLHRAVEGARKLLPQESSAVGDRRSAVGDRCDDDSADDESRARRARMTTEREPRGQP